MLENKHLQLLNNLSTSSYQSAEQLASVLNVSEKTIRLRIRELNSYLEHNGAIIKSQRHLGSKLIIKNNNLFEQFLITLKENKADRIPISSEERIDFLLAFLLNRRDYIKLDVLSELLFISKTVLTSDLKKVEYILKNYNLSINRKPNYGIKLEGKEFDIRLCMANFLIKNQRLAITMGDLAKQKKELKEIGELVKKHVYKNNLRISEISFNNLIVHIFIAIKRVKAQHFINIPEKDILKVTQEKAIIIAKEIVNELEEKKNIDFSNDEVNYLAIHLAGKCKVGKEKYEDVNVIISQEISDLVDIMLEEVRTTYKMEFSHNLDLKLSLCQHLVPFDIRQHYDIPLKNPLLSEIKTQYALAYAIAVQACIPIAKHYEKTISEDEIGYFALIFAIALEQHKDQISKKNILVVCSSGTGSSTLLAYKYKEEFGNYINRVYDCDLFGINDFDFSMVDYVFTTVPISKKLPVPIFEVKVFLDENEITNVRKLLKFEKVDFIYSYYDRNLFFVDVPGKTKEEVLDYMCKNIAKTRQIPEEFYEAVLERERLGTTDFGNGVGLAHPYKVMTEDTFISVGILENNVFWGRSKVKIVFLVSISDSNSKEIQKIYQLTTDLVSSKKKIEELIQSKSFLTLINLLCNKE